MEESIKTLRKEGVVDAMKNSNQNPKELAEMTLAAFDERVKVISPKTLRERIQKRIHNLYELYLYE